MLLLPLYFLGSLAILKLFCCTKVPKYSASLGTIPSDLLYVIARYLHNPFMNLGSLNRSLNDVFTREYPVKRFIQDRFNLFELFTDDIDDNEQELKHILSFSNYANHHIYFYLALRFEFLNGNKFDVLLPHLMNYFHRYRNADVDSDCVFAIIKRCKVSFFFSPNSPYTFSKFADQIFASDKCIQSLQQFLLSNPQHFPQIKDYLKSNNGRVQRWNELALASNMPDAFLLSSPLAIANYLKIDNYFNTYFWHSIDIPKDLFPQIHARMNRISETLEKEDEREHFRLLNDIRFGPASLYLYDRIYSSGAVRMGKVVLLLYCASLSNKIDLFTKLLATIIPEFKTNNDFYFLTWHCNPKPDDPIEAYKYLFDLYYYSHDTQFQKEIYFKVPSFINAVSKFYRLTLFECKEDEQEVKLKFSNSANSVDSGVPEQINIKRNCDSTAQMMSFIRSILSRMMFDNADVLLTYLLILLNDPGIYEINYLNLKLIISSPSIIQFIRNFPIRFSIGLKESLHVVDEPVVPLSDLISISPLLNYQPNPLYKFSTPQQLNRLGILTGRNLSDLLDKKYFDYFRYRHVVKYIITSGQKLNDDLSIMTQELISIDHPVKNYL